MGKINFNVFYLNWYIENIIILPHNQYKMLIRYFTFCIVSLRNGVFYNYISQFKPATFKVL